MTTLANPSSATPSPQQDRQELLSIWRCCLAGAPDRDPYEGVIDELSRYFQLPTDRVRWLCEHSGDVIIQKWLETGQTTTPEAIQQFFRSQTSWLFGTLRYHVNQTQPHGVIVAEALRQLKPGHHLDFGCGAATASLFFQALGWQTSMGDVSEAAINFARWRFTQRGLPAEFYNLNTDPLPANTYSLITAFDVMVHVSDIPETLSRLHTSLKPGGYLVFNIDARKPTLKTLWHLYDTHYPVLRHVRRAGFRRLPKLPPHPLYCFQKTERSPLWNAVVGCLDALRYNPIESAITENVNWVINHRLRGWLGPLIPILRAIRTHLFQK